MISSEGGKISDDMSIKTSEPEPEPCSNGCGFFGTPATGGLCSKCYRDYRIDEEKKASAKIALGKIAGAGSSPDCGVGPSQSVVTNRCSSCNKKLGMLGFQCKCGCTFCGVHRYAEKHGCTFDYKAVGRATITAANPLVKKDKIENRI